MVIKLSKNDLRGKDYKSLTLPSLMQDFIDVLFVDNDINCQNAIINNLCEQNNLPFARSDVYSCKLLNAKLLANIPDAKPIYEILLDISNLSSIKYSPGDTIGILTCNNSEEINFIINKLGYTEICDKEILITNKLNTKKPSKLPSFLPKTLTTIKKLLQRTLDIRSVLKKTFIRMLAEYTTDVEEKLFLQILCSKEGSKDYTELILNNKICILDLLDNISTCRPPFNVLLQNMSRLQPRPYSIANSILSEPKAIKIIFSISNNELRKPLTTSMLEEQIMKFFNKIEENIEIKLYFRSSNGFSYDINNIQDNIIMVGTGTAISPYLSFLEYKAAKIKSENTGTAFLFAGHRYFGNNIYENELETYLKENVLQDLNTAFSREKTSEIKYVQEVIIANSKSIVKLLLNNDKNKTIIYICSANKNMSLSIENSFIEVLVKEQIYDLSNAQNFILEFKKRLQYIEEIWF